MSRIMIVNDDATLTMHLKEYLPTIGYEVKGATSRFFCPVSKTQSSMVFFILTVSGEFFDDQ